MQETARRASDRVEERLMGAILGGAYPPGAALPPERKLAVSLGVARPTLREAMQRLARDGWITVRPGQPPVVNDFWQEGNLNVLDALVRFAESLPREYEHLPRDQFITWLLEVRAALAPAFSRAAVLSSPARVVAALAGYEDLDDDPAAFAAFDWELQRSLARLSGNPVFVLMLNSCTRLYGRAAERYFGRPENRAASRRFYARLLEAAMARDAEEAAASVAEAMQESIALWQETASGEESLTTGRREGG
ncbi:MAG: GntR family transcriptional regulator [Bacillota bacterium]